MPSNLEKEIEKKVCEYAQSKGFLTPKINVIGERGWPDRMFIDPDGWVVWIEFKKLGKKPDPIQIYRMGILAARNFVCETVDSVDQGKELVDALVAARVPEKSNETSVRAGVSRIISGPWTRKN